MNNIPEISIISPVYKAAKIVNELVKQICVICNKEKYNFEIILIDDGSPDNAWNEIQHNCKLLTNVKGIKLSRNFGQHCAITAGLSVASGKYAIVMDCDLQDNPKYIPALLSKIKEGYDIVYTFKNKRKHFWLKNLMSAFFDYLFYFLVNDSTLYNKHIGSYSIISRKAINEFLKIKETDRHYLMLLRWLGFSSATLEVVHEKRYEGKSSYNFTKLITHAFKGITSHSDKLLKISIWVGFFITICSFICITLIFILYFLNGFLSGWASLISVILFSTGLLMLSIGILGLYIGRIFEQTKNRPLFIIEEQINF